MSKHIVVLGSCIVDFITYVDTFPRKGETVVGSRFSTGCGGKGANQAVAASRLGADVRFISRLGDDMMGKFYHEKILETSVNCDMVKVITGESTDIAAISVDATGENIITVVPGVSQSLTQGDLQEASDVISRATVLVCQCEMKMEVTRAALLMAKKHGVKTLMNAAPLTPDLHEDIYKYSDIFCVNETEAECVTGRTVSTVSDALEVCEMLVRERGCGTALITMGGQGVVYYTQQGDKGHVPAEEVTPTDTTGAGDAFMGALAYFLTHHSELQLPELLRRSCAVSTVSVQTEGTQTSLPFRKDLPDHLFL